MDNRSTPQYIDRILLWENIAQLKRTCLELYIYGHQVEHRRLKTLQDANLLFYLQTYDVQWEEDRPRQWPEQRSPLQLPASQDRYKGTWRRSVPETTDLRGGGAQPAPPTRGTPSGGNRRRGRQHGANHCHAIPTTQQYR